MERHGFEWEQKGTHEQHLSVIEYKKQERAKELAAMEEKLAEKRMSLERWQNGSTVWLMENRSTGTWKKAYTTIRNICYRNQLP